MIYVVTLNPSIDYLMEIDKVALGQTNHSSRESVFIGGKGINVSIVLSNLGIQSTLVGFLAGFTGDYIEEQLHQYPHIISRFAHVAGLTRINVKLKGSSETEINGTGSQVSGSDQNHLKDLLATLTSHDMVVLTGRVASGMSDQWYVDVAQSLNERNIPFIVDIANQTMLKLLQYKPLLIKPNQKELEKIFATGDLDLPGIIEHGHKLVDLGARHCIVSMGKEGSILVSDAGVMTASIPTGQLVNSVGAGDSMVAGFIAGWLGSKSASEAYVMAASCGTASAYSTHLASSDLVRQIKEEVVVQQIKEEKNNGNS